MSFLLEGVWVCYWITGIEGMRRQEDGVEPRLNEIPPEPTLEKPNLNSTNSLGDDDK